MKKKLVFLVLLLIIGGGFLSIYPRQNGQDNLQIEDTEKKADGKAGVVLSGLEAPWAIQELNETLYISERGGSIVRLHDGKAEREKVDLEERLSEEGEAGLLGFVLAPGFAESGVAYAYYTYTKSGSSVNRVSILSCRNGVWKEEKTLLDGIPAGSYHQGGRMKIGPDNKLYVTTGDAKQAENAQDLESLSGKILRMNLDGTIPADNPFKNSYVYSYGHRNPQGLAWDDEGRLYSSEHGESGHDEINVIMPGRNYGWPAIEGMEKKQGMETPIIQSGNDTWAPSGIAYSSGKLYIASLKGEALQSLELPDNKLEEVTRDKGRIRDVFIDGTYVYFITNNTDGRGDPEEKDDRLYKMLLVNLP